MNEQKHFALRKLPAQGTRAVCLRRRTPASDTSRGRDGQAPSSSGVNLAAREKSEAEASGFPRATVGPVVKVDAIHPIHGLKTKKSSSCDRLSGCREGTRHVKHSRFMNTSSRHARNRRKRPQPDERPTAGAVFGGETAPPLGWNKAGTSAPGSHWPGLKILACTIKQEKEVGSRRPEEKQ